MYLNIFIFSRGVSKSAFLKAPKENQKYSGIKIFYMIFE